MLQYYGWYGAGAAVGDAAAFAGGVYVFDLEVGVAEEAEMLAQAVVDEQAEGHAGAILRVILVGFGDADAEIRIGRTPVARDLGVAEHTGGRFGAIGGFQAADEIDRNPAATVVFVELIGVWIVQLREVHFFGHLEFLHLRASKKAQEK